MVSNIFYLRLGSKLLPGEPGASQDFGWACFAMLPWGEAGDVPQWSVNCCTLTSGQCVSIVLDVITIDVENGRMVGSLFPGRSQVRVVGSLEWDSSWFSVSILDAKYEGQCNGMHQFSVATTKQILGHRILDKDALMSVVETCSGLGVLSFGLVKAGFRIVAANDASGPLIGAYRDLHPEVSAVEGDIWCNKTLSDLHAVAPAAAVLSAGFSCQPFSAGGRQLGGLDSRSSTLPGVLRAALLLRKPLVILECVASARSNRYVRTQIESFCTQCGYALAEQILKLEEIWVSKRERWWAVLSVASMGSLKLVDFPSCPHPKCVYDILPRPFDMPESDLQQIIASYDEHRVLLKYCDPKAMILSAGSKCPTALHSWGSQVLPCPCGCRPSGFSDSTLSSRGIYGVFMPSEGSHVVGDDSFQRIRHLHPSELAALTGCPIPTVWPQPLRLALCGLGQQASPLQAVWIAGQLHRMLDRFLGFPHAFDYHTALYELMRSVSEQAQDLFGDSSVSEASPNVEPETPVLQDAVQISVPDLPSWVSHFHVGGPMAFTVQFEDTQQCEVVSVSHPDVTVGNFRAAEVHINPLVSLWDVVDCQTGEILPNDAAVVRKCLLIRKTKGVLSGLDSFQDNDVDMEDACLVRGATPDAMVEVSPTLAFPLPDEVSDPVSVDVDVEPLLHLSMPQLLEVAPPAIGSFEVLQALRAQNMPVTTRCSLLQRQDVLWADDEIKWHIEDMISKSSQVGWVLLDPLVASVSLTKRMASVIVPWFERLGFMPGGIVTCVQVYGHWIPLVWTWNSSQLVCRSWDIQRPTALNMSLLHEAIALAVGARTWSTHVVHRNFAVGDLCGVCAVRFVDSVLRGKMLPDSREEAVSLHATGRQLFVDSLVDATCTRPWVWGGGLDPLAHQRLVDVMVQHGVPDDMVENRISLMVQALGLGPIQKVMVGTSPWRGLKSLANQARPPFQLVLSSELAEAVKVKAQQGGQQKRKKGTGKGAIQPPQALDPAKLKIEPGFFTQVDGTPLRVIGFAQIGPFAEGVALASTSAVEQILASGKIVSKFPLAVVIINADPDGLQTALSWCQLRVPVRCVANDDPMLVHACVVQLGEGTVTQKSAAKVKVDDVKASCVKIAVYRDCLSCPWSEFVGGPVRYILDRLVSLQVCNLADDACDCPKWHVKETGIRDPVLDVWRRQWVSSTFKMVSPDQAEIFFCECQVFEGSRA